MTTADLNRATAAAWAAVPTAHRPEVLVGFDGFVDNIIHIVAQRHSPTEYTRLPTISDLGAKISAAAGKSAGIGAVLRETRLGGNGPLMANGLAAQGAAVNLVGILGAEAVEPIFQPLAARSRQAITLGPPAVTDALEFDDGKVMLNYAQELNVITYDHLLARCGGRDGLRSLLWRNAGVATVNWSQTPFMTDIWRRCAAEILPGGPRLRWFVDLADPHRCTPEDIRAGLAALREVQAHADVVLGLNENECRQMCGIAGIPYPEGGSEWDNARRACVALREHLGLAVVMCHLVRSSAVAWDGGSTAADGFYCAKPKTTTGVGDHYNAGFFSALLAGLPYDQCLQIGGATSGHYVRTGESPTRAQVVAFLTAAVQGRAAG